MAVRVGPFLVLGADHPSSLKGARNTAWFRACEAQQERAALRACPDNLEPISLTPQQGNFGVIPRRDVLRARVPPLLHQSSPLTLTLAAEQGKQASELVVHHDKERRLTRSVP